MGTNKKVKIRAYHLFKINLIHVSRFSLPSYLVFTFSTMLLAVTTTPIIVSAIIFRCCRCSV